ncbi:hypothetical protein K1719_007300 [Acacia pycnantha]|nr:hypothetical protein K1719_007300 [Acacia pycnantha]
MASSWFFILLLKCIDFLSWPVLALGYPLCASIEAIENESHSETRDLISYWILLSLIYLFEYAFLRLLQWFQYWHYMKLMIVAFLMTPDFGRAAYVYNQLIRSCIYMNPQAVISRFRSWKNIFAKNEDFKMQAEKYITQNGTETFEKLLASKKTEQIIHAETRKEVPTTTEKNEILKTNRGRLLMEQKDIKDLEMIEKEVPEGNQANAALDRLKSNESTSSTMEKTEKMPSDTEHGTYSQISAYENEQKEWTCGICQLTMPSESKLNSHLRRGRHKAASKALNMKTKAMSVIDTRNQASLQVPASKNVQQTWTCAVCQLTKLSEANVKSHLQGKKHKAACEALNGKNQLVSEKGLLKKNDKFIGEQEKMINTTSNATLEQKKITNSHHPKMERKNIDQQNTKVQELQKNVGTSVGMNNCRFRCDMCNANCTSESDLASHLQGKRHLAQIQLLSGPS